MNYRRYTLQNYEIQSTKWFYFLARKKKTT